MPFLSPSSVKALKEINMMSQLVIVRDIPPEWRPEKEANLHPALELAWNTKFHNTTPTHANAPRAMLIKNSIVV